VTTATPEGAESRLVAELRARIAELEAMLDTLVGQNDRLLARVEELERELGRHSGNSGKPPSSDSVTQRKEQQEERLSRAERRRRARAKAKELLKGTDTPKRRPGKQAGEPGARLEPVEDPDRVVDHRPEQCSDCGSDLSWAEVTATERRQVFDLPRRRLEVTEHRAMSCRCRCGSTTKAAFPAVARATTCYGTTVRALACYMVARQHLPVARAAELLGDALGAAVSTGWLSGITMEAAAGLEPFLEELRRQLISADVLHADETGARISGARWWFHVACTDLLTLLDCHQGRGVEAFSDMAVLPFFGGVVVHDGWKSYWSVGHADHALCCAHLLRDLASIAQVAQYQGWADQMADLLVAAKNAVEAAWDEGRSGMTKAELRLWRRRYNAILKAGYASVPAVHRAGSYDRDAYNLLSRFDNSRAEIQRHWVDAAVSFDNNQAERDVRMVKLQQKISGCFRTVAGARAFCAVRSYLQTAAKHGVGQLDALNQLFNGTPWMPARAGP
jgi:transposase